MIVRVALHPAAHILGLEERQREGLWSERFYLVLVPHARHRLAGERRSGPVKRVPMQASASQWAGDEDMRAVFLRVWYAHALVARQQHDVADAGTEPLLLQERVAVAGRQEVVQATQMSALMPGHGRIHRGKWKVAYDRVPSGY